MWNDEPGLKLEAQAKFLARIKPTPDSSLNEPNFKKPLK